MTYYYYVVSVTFSERPKNNNIAREPTLFSVFAEIVSFFFFSSGPMRVRARDRRQWQVK